MSAIHFIPSIRSSRRFASGFGAHATRTNSPISATDAARYRHHPQRSRLPRQQAFLEGMMSKSTPHDCDRPLSRRTHQGSRQIVVADGILSRTAGYARRDDRWD